MGWPRHIIDAVFNVSHADRLRHGVMAAVQYRRPIEDDPPLAGSPVLVVGQADDVKNATCYLNNRGFHVINRNEFKKGAAHPVVFAGAPRKFLFSSSAEYGRYVLWLNSRKVKKRLNPFYDPTLIDRHLPALESFSKRLRDKESLLTLYSVLAARVRNDNSYLRIADYQEYAHPRVRARAGDVIVDAGAHVGKVSAMFAGACGPSGVVYAFEPDPQNFSQLQHRCSKAKNIVPIHAGVWSTSGSLSFDNLEGSASRSLSESGGIRVPVVSLDDFFAEPGRRVPTLMKFDVEGAESATLTGAAETIRRHKPRLMVSAYHKPSDIWDLAEHILSIRADYKIYLGHHNFYHTETDLYAE